METAPQKVLAGREIHSGAVPVDRNLRDSLAEMKQGEERTKADLEYSLITDYNEAGKSKTSE